MQEQFNSVEKKYNKWIIILSILIPVVVAILFRVKLSDFGMDVQPLTFLPPIYATINGITAVLLVFAVKAIKNGNRALHERLVKIAITCSVLFLAMYVAYHMTSESTSYGGEGVMRGVYFFILITHILLSIIIIPFVLITYVRGISGNFAKHRKIAKITFPLWLYVAVSGVIVYLMISPYYVY
jgi:putative membrane protein